MMYYGFVKVAPGKPQTGQVKLKFSRGTRDAKFLLGEGKKSTRSGFTGFVTEGCCVRTVPPMMWLLCFL